MIDEQKLREKLRWLFAHSKYSHISTGVMETLPDEIVEIARECEIPEKPKKNTLTTAVTEKKPRTAKKRSHKRDPWLP